MIILHTNMLYGVYNSDATTSCMQQYNSQILYNNKNQTVLSYS
jgi:hypothetical protein